MNINFFLYCRVSWIYLLLLGGCLPFPQLNGKITHLTLSFNCLILTFTYVAWLLSSILLGYMSTSKTDQPNIRGAKDGKLDTSPSGMSDAYGRLKGYLDQRKKVPLAAAQMTSGDKTVSNSISGNRDQAAPVETPAYPCDGADLTMDSTSCKDAAQPVLQPLMVPFEQPSAQRPQEVSEPLASTYLVQANGGYGRGSLVFSRKKYFRGYPPPPSYVLMSMRPESKTGGGD